MSTHNKPISAYPQSHHGTNSSRLENGHLQWSSWTQRRLLYIGAPVAGLLTLALPFALYASRTDGTPAMSSKTVDREAYVSRVSKDTVSETVYSSILNVEKSSPGISSNSHSASLAVNDTEIPIADNEDKTITIDDVSGTTTVIASSKSSQKTTESLSENSSSLNVEIYHNRSP